MSIEVISGTFSYSKDRPLLRDISFDVRKGEVLAILGPNGAGKTTLIKCLLGFNSWENGRTGIDGKDIREIKGRSLWQKISYVPQAKKPSFTYKVKEMVLLGRNPYLGDFSLPGKEDRLAADKAMETAGISHLQDRNCSEISGGELQLVMVARALAAEPEYLILDEPESGLDFRNQLIVLDLIRKLSTEQDITVILNTHYPDHALRISDKVLLLFGNGIYQFGRTRQILTDEHLKALFGVDIALWNKQLNGREYSAVIPLEILDQGSNWI